MHELGVRQLDLSWAGQHVLVGRGDIDNAGQHNLPMLRLLDLQGGMSSQQLGKKTFMGWVEVLHNQNTAGEARRQRPQKLSKGVKTPGRGADGNYVKAAGGIAISG